MAASASLLRPVTSMSFGSSPTTSAPTTPPQPNAFAQEANGEDTKEGVEEQEEGDGEAEGSGKTRGPRPMVQNLVGPQAAGAQVMRDLNDKPGIFFIFSDLCVRTEGEFLGANM